MEWDTILKYESIIKKIASKYSGEPSLAEDVAQEVMIKLYEDKKLDISKFDPKKIDAAIRNTIRNKTLKVLRSRKIGRWGFQSLDTLQEAGFQFGDDRSVHEPYDHDKEDLPADDYWAPQGDNNITQE